MALLPDINFNAASRLTEPPQAASVASEDAQRVSGKDDLHLITSPVLSQVEEKTPDNDPVAEMRRAISPLSTASVSGEGLTKHTDSPVVSEGGVAVKSTTVIEAIRTQQWLLSPPRFACLLRYFPYGMPQLTRDCLAAFLQHAVASLNSLMPVFHQPTVTVQSMPVTLILALLAYGILSSRTIDRPDMKHCGLELYRRCRGLTYGLDLDNVLDPVHITVLLVTEFTGVCFGSRADVDLLEFHHSRLIVLAGRLLASVTGRPSHVNSTPVSRDRDRHWRSWVQEEMKKRIIASVTILDVQMSFLCHYRPSGPLHDCRTIHCCSDKLWHAGDAESWSLLVHIANHSEKGISQASVYEEAHAYLHAKHSSQPLEGHVKPDNDDFGKCKNLCPELRNCCLITRLQQIDMSIDLADLAVYSGLSHEATRPVTFERLSIASGRVRSASLPVELVESCLLTLEELLSASDCTHDIASLMVPVVIFYSALIVWTYSTMRRACKSPLDHLDCQLGSTQEVASEPPADFHDQCRRFKDAIQSQSSDALKLAASRILSMAADSLMSYPSAMAHEYHILLSGLARSL